MGSNYTSNCNANYKKNNKIIIVFNIIKHLESKTKSNVLET